MAARRKTVRRKATRSSLGGLELPRNLGEFRKELGRRLNQLEKQVERAERQTRRQAARLLREASHQLGRLEVRGESGWRQLTDSYRRELVRLLRRLERAVAPRRAARKKTTARKKKVTRKKVAARARPSVGAGSGTS